MKISRFEVKITEHTSCRTCPHRCTNFLNKMSYGCKLQQESGGRFWYDKEEQVFADCMFLHTVNPESELARLRKAIEDAPRPKGITVTDMEAFDCWKSKALGEQNGKI